MDRYDIANNLLSRALKSGMDGCPSAHMIEEALFDAEYRAFEEAKDMLAAGGFVDAARYLNQQQKLKEMENLY